MEFLLQADKLSSLKKLLSKLIFCRKTTLRELQSVLGLINFTFKVIPMGRTFSKRLYNATCGVKSPFDHIRLTKPLKDNLKIWYHFISNFNGHTLWQEEMVSSPAIQLYTDATGTIGFGAYYNNHWAAETCPELWIQQGYTRKILLLELFSVLVALTIWGEDLKNRRMNLHSDNKGLFFVPTQA